MVRVAVAVFMLRVALASRTLPCPSALQSPVPLPRSVPGLVSRHATAK